MLSVLNAVTIAGVLAAGCPFFVAAAAFLIVCAMSGKLAEDNDPANEDEPTAEYEPCGHTWPTDSRQPCGDGHWHACKRMRNGHRRHVCVCSAVPEAAQLRYTADRPGWHEFTGRVYPATTTEVTFVTEPLAVDPPVVPAYAPPALDPAAGYGDRTKTRYGLAEVCVGCLAARRDAATDHICADCARVFGRGVIV